MSLTSSIPWAKESLDMFNYELEVGEDDGLPTCGAHDGQYQPGDDSWTVNKSRYSKQIESKTDDTVLSTLDARTERRGET